MGSVVVGTRTIKQIAVERLCAIYFKRTHNVKLSIFLLIPTLVNYKHASTWLLQT